MTKKSKWIFQTLKKLLRFVKKMTHSLRKVNQSWNIPLLSILDYLNGKTRSRKMGPNVVLTYKSVVTQIRATTSVMLS
jgi:hypothetical protein